MRPIKFMARWGYNVTGAGANWADKRVKTEGFTIRRSKR